ncbi:MAG: hypothetical protein WA861_05840, partial [Candidatus Binatus sp.]
TVARKKTVSFSSRALRKVSLVLALLLSVSTGGMAAENVDSRAAAAVFSQYETVFYTNTDLSSRFSSFKGLSRQSAGSLSLPFAYLMGALDSLDPRASEEILGKTDALVAGVRDFIPPEGEGGAQLGEFSYVASFGKRGTPSLDKYFNQVPTASVGGAPVWRWVGKIYGENAEGNEIYASQVDHSHLVFASDLQELKGIARKLSSPDDGSSVLNKIPEWAAVSQHEYWGYRKVPRHDGTIEKEAAHLEFTVPGAETIIMFADVEKKVAVVRVLGVHANEVVEMTKRRDEQQRKALKRLGMGPFPSPETFKATDARTLEETFSLSGGEQTEGEILTALALFGYEILI